MIHKTQEKNNHPSLLPNVNLLIYGRIIIDTIRLPTGEIVSDILGGGAPQAAFGARLWNPSVGLLLRSGSDIGEKPATNLRDIGVDLSGWVQYPDLPTPKSIFIDYDLDDHRIDEIDMQAIRKRYEERFGKLHSRIIPIPEHFRHPRAIHYITDFASEPMTPLVLALKQEGVFFSLEPMFEYRHWTNKQDLLNLVAKADVVTPDWPSARGISGSDKPVEVLKYWSKFGPKLIAVRDGARGSYVWEGATDQMWHVPIVRAELVDPTGCGNSYGGGLCAGWDKYRDARMAAGCATVSASYLAGCVGVPTVDEPMEREAKGLLERLLEEIKPL